MCVNMPIDHSDHPNVISFVGILLTSAINRAMLEESSNPSHSPEPIEGPEDFG